LVTLAVGVLPIALAGQAVSIPTLLAGLALVGLGIGLATPRLQTSGVEAVESDQAGSAAGLCSTSRYLGSIIGSAIIAGILGASDVDVDGLSLVFLLPFVAAVVAAVVSLGLRGRAAVSAV
jgi:sugar phosphate permease